MALLTTRPKTQATRTSVGEVVAEVRGHHRSYGSTQVLRGVDLTLRRGEFVALLGRSGSGKSTLLRSLAGLDPALRDEVDVTGRSSVAFQEPRLLPWRKVERNVELALLNTVRDGTRPEKVRSALDEVSLTEKADVWPGSLSGGQAQRVSLARALVSEPDLMLLDEPFSALDALTRIEMHALVTQLWERHEPAILLVTHDVDEAIALADRVLVLDEGRIAREWHVDVRRESRTPEHHEIARLREHVLGALGVTAKPSHHQSDNQSHNQSHNQESGAA
jgi:sulfonate transport system ATP-binding protein